MVPRDDSQPKTPQEALEIIVTHKKHTLMENPQTPERIKNFLRRERSDRSTAEIIAHIVFPESDLNKSRGYMVSSLLSPRAIKDEEFNKLKSTVQRAEHLTEHTRLSVLNILDDLRKK